MHCQAEVKEKERGEIELKLEAPQQATECCCVCFDASAVGAFVPCGHKCCCLRCGVNRTTSAHVVMRQAQHTTHHLFLVLSMHP